MPKYEFVATEEEALLSGHRALSLPPSAATRRIARTGRRTPSQYRSLLVPTFSLGESNGQGDSLSSFSLSSVVYSTDNEGDVWITKIEYHPRDESKKVGCKPSTTTIITSSRDGKQQLYCGKDQGVRDAALLEEQAQEDVKEIMDGYKNEEDAELLAAHLYFDKKFKDEKLIASSTLPAALSSEKSPTQHCFFIDLSALLQRLFDSFWECAVIDGCSDDGTEEKRLKSNEETDFTDDDETLTYNDVSTYTSTLGDDGPTTIETGTTRYDDDTLTFNDTLTYNDTLTHRGFDGSTLCEDETLDTYNDGTTLGDEISVMEEGEGRDDIESTVDSVRNQDSSYGSGSFRSPLSDSYRSTSHSRLPLGESQSRSLRSNSQFRISLLPPDNRNQGLKVAVVDETDSLSYTKSRSLNRNLINSFIELKSNSVSTHNQRENHSEHQQEPKKNVDSPLVIFTIDDVEELEQFESEKRDEAKEDIQDQPEPIWRKFDTPSRPVQSEQKAPKANDLSSKSVKITITKTQKNSHSEDEGEITKSSSYYTPPNSCHSRSIHSRSNSPSRMRHYDRDDDNVDGNDLPDEIREDAESTPLVDDNEVSKPSYRIAGPVLPVHEDPATIAASESPAKKISAEKIDTNAEEDLSAIIALRENLSPIARLRNPMSYDVLASN
eukprot:CAMPEP_0116139386 /NCGR_PEP_ID=MMETSP0329-20121206/13288_1 /TAXON_ID=697910 /ORGANISM="Pseudo-nitzschia arenysensis, Strain B593" /LENGTH=663 /DNA_ID=CAMNT_0003634433 /DNA_START=238 /DNA_END=2229 /DNA_ORIENTATION=-